MAQSPSERGFPDWAQVASWPGSWLPREIPAPQLLPEWAADTAYGTRLGLLRQAARRFGLGTALSLVPTMELFLYTAPHVQEAVDRKYALTVALEHSADAESLIADASVIWAFLEVARAAGVTAVKEGSSQ